MLKLQYFQRYIFQLGLHARKPVSVGLQFDFTTTGDWDWLAAVERFPAPHYSADFIFLPFGIVGFIVELWNY